MLHTYTRQSVDQGAAQREPGFAELFELIHRIFRQQLLIILPIAILVTALGALYVFTSPPVYTAQAALMIDKGTVQIQLGGIMNEVPIEVGSQIQLIKSEAVALAVVKKLNLADDPEIISPPAGILGKARAFLSGLLRTSDPSDSEAPSYNELDFARMAASNILDRLKVTRTGYLFDIEFSSLKSVQAAEVANAFAEAYIENQLKSRHQAAQEASAWLKGQIQELRDQSLRADAAVAQFKAKNNIVAADGRLINDQQMTLLNNQLVMAREKTAETRARLDRIEAVINANSPDKRAIATVTDTLNNPIIVKLRSQYLDLINRESLWSREYGKDHLAVVNLRRQIREIQGSIHDELRRIGETYRSEHEIAKQRQSELEKAVADAKSQHQETSQALTALRDLESSAETFRGLYRTALQRGTELVQKESFPGAEARLIARASPPTGQSSPKTLVVLFASAMGGIMLGFAAGALRASLDRMFRTSAQVEAALQTRCLALAPAVRRAKVRISPPNPKTRTIKRNEGIIWDIVNRPLSRFAEAMRTIRLEVQLSGPKKSITVLGFTSSLPKEGKSTIAASFALLTAQSGARAILVDCDLRNPALSAMLAPTAESGLLEVISGRKQLEEVLWNDPTTGLVFLPTVMKKSRAAESSAVLASPSLRAFFEKLRQKYDYVIVDFSPTAPIIDVQSTTGLVDSYVFVVEWGRTHIDVAELALSKATVVQENLLGVVLNKVNFKTLGHYEGYRRDYYSDKHYGQYGQV
jgi:succinoglycan biosynthesis transport protein ExoP